MTRFASVLGVPVESAEIELRATFPQEAKFGLSETAGVAMERLDYLVDIRSPAPLERVAELMTAATKACHAENSLRVPVEVAPLLRLNGVDLPFERTTPPELRRDAPAPTG